MKEGRKLFPMSMCRRRRRRHRRNTPLTLLPTLKSTLVRDWEQISETLGLLKTLTSAHTFRNQDHLTSILFGYSVMK